MQEELKNTPDIDPSGMFNTYKAHPSSTESGENIVAGGPYPIISQKKEEQNHSNEPNTIRALRIVVDGLVRILKISIWGIAVFGGLFITALATNTINRAVEIFNTNIGTHIAISGEVSAAQQQTQKAKTGLTSSTLNTLPAENESPEAIASKQRRAILEAKKAAKILEEKQKILEQSSQ